MELKSNMYVRTKHNGIKKVVALYVDAIFTDNHIRIENKDIIKASYNIIDLIEVGDYVNGFRVIWKTTNAREFGINAYYEEERYINSEQDIKSIVTKEQFESMSYKVGE